MLERIREAKKNEDGFTLIELLIVIVILGVLAAIVVFSVSGITDRGKASACQADVQTVTVAGEAYIAGPGNGTPAAAIDDATHSATTLVGAGLLHAKADDVKYTVTGTTFTAVAIAGTSPC
ncbi:MAG: ral secretion pathway protein [Pseudonocardiales bacterium]|nr:ral secretion pathway protein [Pseudonocardiales bacterium]